MRPLVQSFKKAILHAAALRSFPVRELMEDHDLAGFLQVAEEEDYALAQLAAQALHYFCQDDDGAFNGFEVGLLAVMEFLTEQQGRPQGWQQGFRDMVNLLQNGATLEALQKWAEGYTR